MPYKDPAARKAQQQRWREAHKKDIAAYQRRWRAAHPEDVQRYHTKHRETHAASIALANALYRAAHKETLRDKGAAYYQSHKERILAYYAARYLDKKDVIRLRNAAWEANNPEKARAKAVRRRARKAGATRNDLTGVQWLAIKKMYGHRCVYCNRHMQRLTMDHITPLSKGGDHTLTNVVPACRSCNGKKGVKEPLVPVQPLLLVAS